MNRTKDRICSNKMFDNNWTRSPGTSDDDNTGAHALMTMAIIAMGTAPMRTSDAMPSWR